VKRLTSCLFLFLAIALLMAEGAVPRALADKTGSNGHVSFIAAGSGTEMSQSPAGCQTTGTRDCTLQMTGMFNGFPLIKGTYTTTLTVHWGSSTPNGNGGSCAPADGPTTLTALDGDQVTLQNTGTFCEIGPTGPSVPHRYTGTFTITGGTGQFANAAGTGTVIIFDDGMGHSYFLAWGKIFCQSSGF
jgi:hypothetical protein